MAAGSYAEGDVVAVALEGGGFGLCVVARRQPKGHQAIGYFFGPPAERAPAAIPELTPERAVMIKRFGDGEILSGRWPNLGQLPGWNRAKWPNPVFGTTVTAELGSRVQYPDDDPGGKPQVDYVPLADVRGLPKDGLAGPGWIEGVLDLRLHERPSAPIWVGEERPGATPPNPGPPRGARLTGGQQNDLALGGLLEAGSDPARPNPFHFYVYFEDRPQADRGAEAIRDRGYAVEVTEGVTERWPWLVLATTEFAPDPAELERREAEFGRLAAELGANYDGWEADVVRDP